MPENSNTSTPQRARRHGQRLTTEERNTAQDKFIQAFASSANMRAACFEAKINRSTVYNWLEKDAEFTVRYHQAEKDATDMLLAAAWQRAVHGVEKPVVSMGKQVYVEGKNGKMVPLMERVYSDSVLLRLMSWKIPGFREKQQVEHSGSIDVTGARDSLMSKLSTLPQQESDAETEDRRS